MGFLFYMAKRKKRTVSYQNAQDYIYEFVQAYEIL